MSKIGPILMLFQTRKIKKKSDVTDLDKET